MQSPCQSRRLRGLLRRTVRFPAFGARPPIRACAEAARITSDTADFSFFFTESGSADLAGFRLTGSPPAMSDGVKRQPRRFTSYSHGDRCLRFEDARPRPIPCDRGLDGHAALLV